MELAAKVLVLGGLFNLLVSFVTGNCMAAVRSTKPEVPKALRLAHVGPLMWAPLLFGLVIVLQLSPLHKTWELVAAISMVAASVLLGLKDILYWLRGVGDEFAEKPALFLLNIPATLGFALGLGIFTVGALYGL